MSRAATPATLPAAIDGRTRVLVYFNGTFINRENGAHARFWDQLTWISRTYTDVTLYSYADHQDCPWGEAEIAAFRSAFSDVELVLERRTPGLRLLRRLKNAAMTLAPRTLRWTLDWCVPGVTPQYERLRARGSHILFANYVDCFTELNGVSSSRCIIETHDVKFLIFSKTYAKPISDLRTLGKFRSEVFLLESACGLVAIAPPEEAMFKLWFPDKPIFYIPQYQAANRVPQACIGQAYDMLFVGSENTFNVTGLTTFLTQSAWAADYRICVAGRICDVASVREAAASRPNVSLLGYVEDLAPVYARSKVVISPVEGTGLKIKALDALAAGKPVLASERTRQGLSKGYEGCVFPLTSQVAKWLIEDEAARAEAGEQASLYASGLAGAGQVRGLRDFMDGLLAASVPVQRPAAGTDATGVAQALRRRDPGLRDDATRSWASGAAASFDERPG